MKILFIIIPFLFNLNFLEIEKLSKLEKEIKKETYQYHKDFLNSILEFENDSIKLYIPKFLMDLYEEKD